MSCDGLVPLPRVPGGLIEVEWSSGDLMDIREKVVRAEDVVGVGCFDVVAVGGGFVEVVEVDGVWVMTGG